MVPLLGAGQVKDCPKLLSYPNFIGTIQSFVDWFLAIPFYSYKYKKEHLRIDNEIYEELTYEPYGAKGWLKKRRNARDILISSRLDREGNISYISSSKKFPLTNPDSSSYKSIFDMKRKLREQGILCFDDAYTLAFEYIEQLPKVKILLQKRFSYIFVDEMQDMNQLQYEILEKLFFIDTNGIPIFQRIGDKNQAIFDGETAIEQIWTDRVDLLQLKGSYRLTPQNAMIVQTFGLSPNEVEGRRKHPNGSEILIKPHIILFNNNSVCDVIPKFADIINSLQVSGEIPTGSEQIFKAIGWVKKKDNPSQFGICDYYPEFSIERSTPKIDYSTLESYLGFYSIKQISTLEEIRKNILNAFLRILRLEDITCDDDRFYTKRKLLDQLKDKCPEGYEELKLKVYQWSINTIRGRKEDVLSEIRDYVPVLLSHFGIAGNKSLLFVDNASEELTGSPDGRNFNIFSKDGVNIEVTTVHSSKGQTHTATLYLETSYYKKHESERLCKCFCGSDHECSSGPDIQSIKMAYVGLSRPTYLLCFAVHEDRFHSYLSELDTNIWEIVDFN